MIIELLKKNYPKLSDRAKELTRPLLNIDVETSKTLTLKRLIKQIGCKIDPSVYDLLGQQSNFELWSADLEFLVAGWDFLNTISYSLDELTEYPWAELFGRDEKILGAIIGKYQECVQDNKVVQNVAPFHLVYEKKYDKKMMVAVDALFPVTNPSYPGMPVALVAITRLRQPTIQEIQEGFPN